MHSNTTMGSVQRRGVALIYSVFALIVLIALVAFAVDLGRIHLVKSQLQATADAAARAAVWRIPDQDLTASNGTSAYAVATAVAGKNAADGSAVTVDTSKGDVEIGFWSQTNRTFSKATTTKDFDQANAVHVTVWRSSARGSAIQQDFAPGIGGASSKDLSADSVAMIFGSSSATGHGWGIFGRKWVSLNGNTLVDSWTPPSGPYGHSGGVATNGHIDMVGKAEIDGDARWGPEGSPYSPAAPSGGSVTGWVGRLDSMMNYPSVTAPTTYNNAALSAFTGNPPNLTLTGSNKDFTIPPGTYYVNSITMHGNASLTISPVGAVVIYVKGDVAMDGGTVATAGNIPANLTINVMPPVAGGTSNVDIGGGAALYAHVYAPDSAVKLHGTGKSNGLFGWVIADTVADKGNSEIHYDGTSNGDGVPAHGAFSVQLVR